MPEVVLNAEELLDPLAFSRARKWFAPAAVEQPLDPLAPSPSGDDDDTLVEFSADPSGHRKFWGMVLLMAVRDGATSLHYQPWRRPDDAFALWYVVANVWYGLMTPPPDYAPEIIDMARSLFAPRTLLARLGLRSSATTCATVILDIAGTRIVWDAVCWSSGKRAGVELHRVTPFTARENNSGA